MIVSCDGRVCPHVPVAVQNILSPSEIILIALPPHINACVITSTRPTKQISIAIEADPHKNGQLLSEVVSEEES